MVAKPLCPLYKNIIKPLDRARYPELRYFLEEAALVGSNTTAAVQSILNRTKHVEQSYKSCQGVLSLKRKYGKERLEKACKRLAGCTSITYTTIRNVLEKNLDQVDGEETVSNVPQNDYVRGAEAFMNI